MAPIDLPPEPSLNQPPTGFISAAAPQIKQSSRARYLLTNLQSAPNQSTAHLLEIADSPTSLIPPEQLSATYFEDFSQPNLAQLPPLPPETDSAPTIPPEETLETINDAIDSEPLDTEVPENIEPADRDVEVLENIEPTDLEPTEQQIETNDLSPDAINLDNVDPSDIDLDSVNPNELDTDAPEIDQIPDVLEDSDIDVDGVTSEDSPAENSQEEL